MPVPLRPAASRQHHRHHDHIGDKGISVQQARHGNGLGHAEQVLRGHCNEEQADGSDPLNQRDDAKYGERAVAPRLRLDMTSARQEDSQPDWG